MILFRSKTKLKKELENKIQIRKYMLAKPSSTVLEIARNTIDIPNLYNALGKEDYSKLLNNTYINKETAMLLSVMLDVDASFFVNLQERYEAACKEIESLEKKLNKLR